MSAREAAISADHHKGIDLCLFDLLVGLLPAFCTSEFRTAGRLQKSTSLIQNIPDRPCIQFHALAIDQALKALPNANHFLFVKRSGTHNSPDGCIHPRRISAGR